LEFAEIVGLPAAGAVGCDGEEFAGEGHGGAVIHLAARGESRDFGGDTLLDGGGVNGAPAGENGIRLLVRGNEVELFVSDNGAIEEWSVGEK